jgi:hypothetical protein
MAFHTIEKSTVAYSWVTISHPNNIAPSNVTSLISEAFRQTLRFFRNLDNQVHCGVSNNPGFVKSLFAEIHQHSTLLKR